VLAPSFPSLRLRPLLVSSSQNTTWPPSHELLETAVFKILADAQPAGLVLEDAAEASTTRTVGEGWPSSAKALVPLSLSTVASRRLRLQMEGTG
jgi:hypothetical protein